MLRKNIKYNSVPRKLCILNFDESRDIFGTFSNDEFDNYYKNISNKCELRGLEFTPSKKLFELNQETVDMLKKQVNLFESLFNWFIDVYKQIDTLTKPQQFSTPYFLEECNLDDKYLFIFNDFQETEFNLDNYTNFLNMFSYPEKILKVNDSILRSHLNQMMDIEGLKVSGLIRDFNEVGIYEKLLQAQIDGRIDNEYFRLASEATKSYKETKRLVDAQLYADEKLKPFESEYLILNNVRFNGEVFARQDFTIDRILLTKAGIFVLGLINYGNKMQTLEITADNKWQLRDNESQNIIQEIDNSIIEDTALNCIAIKKLLRVNFGEEADKIPVKPVIIISNDEVRIDNRSHNQIIRGSNIYQTIESLEGFMNMDYVMEIGNTIYSYRIKPLNIQYNIYISDLESAESVYQDLYYNHIQFYLPKLIELIWKVEKEDYYQSNIKKNTLIFIVGCSGFLGALLRIIAGLVYSSSFTQNILSLFLWNALLVLCLGLSIGEFIKRKSWINASKTGVCYEISDKLAYFNIGPSFFFTLLITIIQVILLNFI